MPSAQAACAPCATRARALRGGRSVFEAVVECKKLLFTNLRLNPNSMTVRDSTVSSRSIRRRGCAVQQDPLPPQPRTDRLAHTVPHNARLPVARGARA